MRILLPMLFLAIAIAPTALGQAPSYGKIYMATDFERAYEKGTRSPDGRPGSNYWQNHARYDMNVRVNVADQMVEGEEDVTYINNSPDQLNRLVVKMLADMFRKGNPRDYTFDQDAITEGAEVTFIAINGEELDLEGRAARRSGTNWNISLPEALQPGDSLLLSIRWKEDIPKEMIRVGVSDSTSFFVGYFYPQVAVYDDVFGWDNYNYTGYTETYNELADYDVRITVPESHFVQATGMLVNAEEVMSDEMYEAYQNALTSDETHFLTTAEDAENGYTMKGDTWHYRASNVPDFAFFTSDHFIWDATSQEVDGRRVFISSIYPTRTADRYAEVSQMQRDIMDYFSTEITGIPYPYPAYSSINADQGGGMEFPMLANNGAPGNKASMAGLTAHEMHHMYFPFYVRINERRFAWMDEGWADYITDFCLINRIMGEDYADQARQNMLSSLQGAVGSYAHMPLIISSRSMHSENYGFSSYSLPHYVYDQLYQHLGEETFLRCMREYMRRWAYKSPTPYDFFFSFEDVSGQDLSWFWNDWFFEFGGPDLAIGEVNGRKITLRNEGGLSTAVDLVVTYADGEQETLNQPGTVWDEGKKSITLKTSNKGDITKIVLNAMALDGDVMDNIYLSEWPSEADQEELLGEYKVNDAISLILSRAGKGALDLEVIPYGIHFAVFPDGNGGYEGLSGSPKVTFNEEDGKVTGIMAQAFGQFIPARKVN